MCAFKRVFGDTVVYRNTIIIVRGVRRCRNTSRKYRADCSYIKVRGPSGCRSPGTLYTGPSSLLSSLSSSSDRGIEYYYVCACGYCRSPLSKTMIAERINYRVLLYSSVNDVLGGVFGVRPTDRRGWMFFYLFFF